MGTTRKPNMLKVCLLLVFLVLATAHQSACASGPSQVEIEEQRQRTEERKRERRAEQEKREREEREQQRRRALFADKDFRATMVDKVRSYLNSLIASGVEREEYLSTSLTPRLNPDKLKEAHQKYEEEQEQRALWGGRSVEPSPGIGGIGMVISFGLFEKIVSKYEQLKCVELPTGDVLVCGIAHIKQTNVRYYGTPMSSPHVQLFRVDLKIKSLDDANLPDLAGPDALTLALPTNQQLVAFVESSEYAHLCARVEEWRNKKYKEWAAHEKALFENKEFKALMLTVVSTYLEGRTIGDDVEWREFHGYKGALKDVFGFKKVSLQLRQAERKAGKALGIEYWGEEIIVGCVTARVKVWKKAVGEIQIVWRTFPFYVLIPEDFDLADPATYKLLRIDIPGYFDGWE